MNILSRCALISVHPGRELDQYYILHVVSNIFYNLLYRQKGAMRLKVKMRFICNNTRIASSLPNRATTASFEKMYQVWLVSSRIDLQGSMLLLYTLG